MQDKDEKILNEALADAVMDRPREFFIGHRRFCLWTPTLGMSLMLGRHLESIGIDRELMSKNPSIEALRLVREKREDICYILAILSFRSFIELSNTNVLRRRANLYSKELTDEEIAQLSLIVFGCMEANQMIRMSGLEKERQEQIRINEFKNKDGHTKFFGGRTMYGSLIDAACRAYGWSKEYVVWGIDLISLRMMLADKVESIYLSDDEMKQMGIHSTHNQKYGMTPEDIAKLKAMDWN